MSDPYYNPEKFDLKIATSLHADEDYDFHMLVVWQHIKTGDVYYGEGSGCSCPSPFEDYHTLADLTLLQKHDLEQFETQTMNQSFTGRTKGDKMEFLKEVRALFA